MATPLTLTSETVFMLVSLVVIGLGALLAFLSLAAAAGARAAAGESRRSAEAGLQNHRELERLVGDLQRQVGTLRDEIASLGTLKRTLSAVQVESARTAAPAATFAAPPKPAAQPAAVTTLSPVPAPASASVPAPVADEADQTHPFADVTAGQDEVTMLVGKTGKLPALKDDFHGQVMLRVVTGPDAGSTFELPYGRVSIGRAAENQVVLAEDKASRVHAELIFDHTRFVLKDAGSSNGTLRNGKPVKEHPLQFGDRIGIGATELLVTCEGNELAGQDPHRALAAYERLLELQPDFVPALQNYAFLLERDVARRSEADAIWARLKKIERK